MPGDPQLAAQESARVRRTASLIRRLTSTRPLHPDQKAAVLNAAAAIPVVTK